MSCFFILMFPGKKIFSRNAVLFVINVMPLPLPAGKIRHGHAKIPPERIARIRKCCVIFNPVWIMPGKTGRKPGVSRPASALFSLFRLRCLL